MSPAIMPTTFPFMPSVRRKCPPLFANKFPPCLESFCPRLSPPLHSIVDDKMVSPTTSLPLTISFPFVVLLKGPLLSHPQPFPLLYSVLVNTMASTERSSTILPVTVPSPLCQHCQQCPPPCVAWSC